MNNNTIFWNNLIVLVVFFLRCSSAFLCFCRFVCVSYVCWDLAGPRPDYPGRTDPARPDHLGRTDGQKKLWKNNVFFVFYICLINIFCNIVLFSPWSGLMPKTLVWCPPTRSDLNGLLCSATLCYAFGIFAMLLACSAMFCYLFNIVAYVLLCSYYVLLCVCYILLRFAMFYGLLGFACFFLLYLALFCYVSVMFCHVLLVLLCFAMFLIYAQN